MSPPRARRPKITPTPALDSPSPNGQPDLQEQLQQLANELQDAHLVIGRQQIQLLRQEQILQQLTQKLQEQEASG